jgi:hypothetical protein
MCAQVHLQYLDGLLIPVPPISFPLICDAAVGDRSFMELYSMVEQLSASQASGNAVFLIDACRYNAHNTTFRGRDDDCESGTALHHDRYGGSSSRVGAGAGAGAGVGAGGSLSRLVSRSVGPSADSAAKVKGARHHWYVKLLHSLALAGTRKRVGRDVSNHATREYPGPFSRTPPSRGVGLVFGLASDPGTVAIEPESGSRNLRMAVLSTGGNSLRCKDDYARTSHASMPIHPPVSIDDIGSRNGYYTAALLSLLRSRGHELDVRKLLVLVRDSVMKATAESQQPWFNSSSSCEDVFVMPV